MDFRTFWDIFCPEKLDFWTFFLQNVQILGHFV